MCHPRLKLLLLRLPLVLLLLLGALQQQGLLLLLLLHVERQPCLLLGHLQARAHRHQA